MRPSDAGAITAAVVGMALAAVPPQELLNHSSNYLERIGFPVGRAPLAFAPADALPGAAASSARGGITFYGPGPAAGLRELADRYGTRGRLSDRAVDTAHTVIHELVHRIGHRGWYAGWTCEPGAAACVWTWTGARALGQTLAWWEEAAADAVALDVLPHYTRTLFGHRLRSEQPPAYGPRVRQLRVLSVFGSGGRTWRSAEATGWRSRLVMADYPLRAAMLARAMRERVAWGQREGR